MTTGRVDTDAMRAASVRGIGREAEHYLVAGACELDAARAKIAALSALVAALERDLCARVDAGNGRVSAETCRVADASDAARGAVAVLP